MNVAHNNDWRGTTWEDAELNTLRAGAHLTFSEKLQWLEEAAYLAEILRHARVRYPDLKQPGRWIVTERESKTVNSDPQQAE